MGARYRRLLGWCGTGLHFSTRATLRLLRWAFVTIVVLYLLFGAAFLVLRYAVLPQINHYRPQLEQAASAALGLTVRVGEVQAQWQGLRPELTLKEVQLLRRDGSEALRVPGASATVSWWSVPLLGVRLHRLRILEPELSIVRDEAGRFIVGGILIDPAATSDGQFAQWLFAQREISIEQGRVRYVDVRSALAPVDLAGVDALLRNTTFHHRFALQTRAAPGTAAALDLRADFRHAPFARRSDWRAWKGEAYARIEHVDGARWVSALQVPLALRRGVGAVRAWADIDQGQVNTLTADFALADVAVRTAPDVDELSLERARGRLVARMLGRSGGHELALKGFSFRTAGGFEHAPADWSERLVLAPDGSVREGAFSASALDVRVLAELAAHLPFAAAHRDVLERLEPTGVIRGLHYQWQGAVAAPDHYRLDARLADLSIKAQPSSQAPDPAHPTRLMLGAPGFGRLTGEVSMTDAGGRLAIDAPHSSMTFPGLFADPTLKFERLQSQVEWTRLAEGIEVRIGTTHFRNADAVGSLSGTYRSGGKGPGIVNLEGRLSRADATAVYRYLPLTVPAGTRAWAQRAVQAGYTHEASFRLRGDLWDFPYHHDRTAGEFRIAAKVQGVRLNFAPDVLTPDGMRQAWPALEELNGDLVFERNGFSVANASARSVGLQLSGVRGRMDDFSDPRHLLELAGTVGGPMRSLLDYIAASPVAGWLGGALAETKSSGEGRIFMQLSLPLAEMAAAKVKGELMFNDNDVALEPALPPFQRVNGRLLFSEAGAELRGVTAQYLGGPVRLEGAPREGSWMAFRADGTASLQALRRAFDFGFLQRASGAARYGAQVVLRRGGALDIQVDSDLIGAQPGLPAPMSKAVNDALPMHLSLQLHEPTAEQRAQGVRRDEFRLSIGTLLQAALDRERRAGSTRILRAALAIGGDEKGVSLPERGVAVSLRASSLDTDAWREALGAAGSWLGSGPSNPGMGPEGGRIGAEAAYGWPLPIRVDLDAHELVVASKRFDGLKAQVVRDASAWHADIAARQVAGRIEWFDGSVGPTEGLLRARLSRLMLEQAQTQDVTQLLDAAPAEDVPALDVVVDQFEMRGKKFGKLELRASNTRVDGRPVWLLDHLGLTTPDAHLDAHGRWVHGVGERPLGGRRTQLEFTLDVSDVGALLDRIGVREAMRAGTAKLTGQVSWRGSPLALDYPTLDGQLQLAADRGQFLKTEPGVARLIGVLSLQSLPRRITLDFRDVFSEGFAFDTVRANIALENGVARTQDFRMRGINATVVLEGSADIARETQDLHLVVLPEVNAGTASVVYGILANPAVGLGTFLAQLFFREPLMRALSHEYRISGSWTDPRVEKLNVQATPASPTTPP